MTPMKVGFFGLGAASGALSAAAALRPLPDVKLPYLFGYCFGIDLRDACHSASASYYLFPGLIFGVAFAAIFVWRLQIDVKPAIVLTFASGAANAVAVLLCVWLVFPLGGLSALTFIAPFAVAGAISGAAGGAILAITASRLIPGMTAWRAVAAGGMLGLLAPLMFGLETWRVFLFYLTWQAGYSLALASGLPAKV
jgi:hypothetical protein